MIELTPSEVALLVNLMEKRLEVLQFDSSKSPKYPEKAELTHVHRKLQHAEITHYRDQSMQGLRKAI